MVIPSVVSRTDTPNMPQAAVKTRTQEQCGTSIAPQCQGGKAAWRGPQLVSNIPVYDASRFISLKTSCFDPSLPQKGSRMTLS